MSTVNWVGLATLYKRETWRFLKVWNQTITAPVVTTLLFLAILTLAMGAHERLIHGVHYDMFIAPGLIMMAVVQNAFANTSSSLMLMKFQGIINDLLMPPLSAIEITAGMVMGGVSRGLMVAVTVSVAMWFFVPYSISHWWAVVFFIVASSLMLALLGLIAGIFANTFDQTSAITNYIITPLSFLSGTFYSIQDLPPFFQAISHANPFFYMIDGFRYAVIGYSDSSPILGVKVLIATNLVLLCVAYSMIKRGYRLKS
ncbi:MAG: ABC transporter permease [Alphaproteobacteria bacterium]|nr:ABC transporter permease [Alphaproteobacteria bacterium]